MKLLKSEIRTALTIGLLIFLTYLSTKITLMRYEDNHLAGFIMPSMFQKVLTGIIFLLVVAAICIYAFIKKRNSILLGVAIYYIFPFRVFISTNEDFGDEIVLGFIWNPYYGLIHYLDSHFMLLPFALFIAPIILMIINLVKNKKTKPVL